MNEAIHGSKNNFIQYILFLFLSNSSLYLGLRENFQSKKFAGIEDEIS